MKKALASILSFLCIVIATYSFADESKKQRIIEQTKALYNELMIFKNDKAFHEFGFGVGGKNHDWLDRIERIENDPDANLLLENGIAVGEVKMLGLEYIKSKGKETEYTQFIIPEIKKALNIKQFSGPALYGSNELIAHKIVKREEFGRIKLSIDVQVELVNGRLPNEHELGAISMHLVKKEKKHDRSFICFYLPGTKVGAGAYATAHHNPKMEVNIMKFMLYQYPQYKKLVSE